MNEELYKAAMCKLTEYLAPGDRRGVLNILIGLQIEAQEEGYDAGYAAGYIAGRHERLAS